MFQSTIDSNRSGKSWETLTTESDIVAAASIKELRELLKEKQRELYKVSRNNSSSVVCIELVGSRFLRRMVRVIAVSICDS